jgi:SAM-dependent methyltransferase
MDEQAVHNTSDVTPLNHGTAAPVGGETSHTASTTDTPEQHGVLQLYPSGPDQSGVPQPLIWAGPAPDHDISADDDSALGSYASTRSATLSDSAYQYKEEHGRRYHAPREDTEYHLPNDDTELNRLDLQHHLFRMTLKGSLHKAPLPRDIHAVLDIGTGTGIWAIDFAEENPTASVIGTDLSPVQPEYVPPNCRFYIENAEEQWDFEHKFDYVHGRMLVVGIRNWARFFEQAYAALKPGGYIELQDLNFPARCDDDSAPRDSPIISWAYLMVEAAAKFNINLQASATFPQLLAAAGFVDVKSETHAWPVNRWPKDKDMKVRGQWGMQNFLNGLQGFSMAYFTRGLGWDKDKVNELVDKVKIQAKDTRSHVYIPISFFWARKPADPET